MAGNQNAARDRTENSGGTDCAATVSDDRCRDSKVYESKAAATGTNRGAAAAREQIAEQQRDENGRVLPGEHTNCVLTRSSTNAGDKAKAAATGTNRGAVQAQGVE